MTDKWRTIFTDLTDDSGCYEMCEINAYQLASHLEELYLKIGELEEKAQEQHKNQVNLALTVSNLLQKVEALEVKPK